MYAPSGFPGLDTTIGCVSKSMETSTQPDYCNRETTTRERGRKELMVVLRGYHGYNTVPTNLCQGEGLIPCYEEDNRAILAHLIRQVLQ